MNTNMTPNAIDELPVSDLAALSASDLATLQAQMAADERALKARSEKLNAALDRRYSETARHAYLRACKDTGSVHWDDAGFYVEATVSKSVEWDQDALTLALDTLPEEDARHLVKAKFTVDERKFSAAMPATQALLSPARTVKPGKMKILVKAREAA